MHAAYARRVQLKLLTEPTEPILKALFAVELSAHIDPWSIDLIKDCFSDCTRVLALYDKRDLIGFAVVRIIVDEAELFTIGIVKSRQGQGLGKLLLAGALRQCKEAGAVCCFLEVRESNAPALALYRRFGFEQIGVRPKYYRAVDGRPAENAVTMRCDLTQFEPALKPEPAGN